MMSKRFFFIIVCMAEWIALSAQGSEDSRLKALNFFCSNRNDILKICNPIFGDTPIFILDFRLNDAEELYIDSNSFNPDSLILGNLLESISNDNFIVNKQIDSSQLAENDTANSFLCDCIYLDPILTIFGVPTTETPLLCKREYGLSLSRVIHYRGLDYVVLRIASFFMAKVDKIQFCIVEFSNDKNILRCGIGNALFVD